jgi:hypothetical protein
VRFEVRYANGALHEVELSGTLAVVGRDPSCDLVLNDAKCSRRHAVIEAGPDGLLVRDSGSANGIYVNGKKADRAALKQGDEIRLGEVVLKVLPEEMPGTLVMGPDEMPELPVAAPAPVSGDAKTVPPSFPNPPIVAPKTPPKAAEVESMPRKAPSAPTPAAPRSPEPRVERAPKPPMAPPARGSGGAIEPLPRPLTGMVLAALWLLAALSEVAGAGVVVWLSRSYGVSLLWAAGLMVMALLSLIIGIGLWMRASWARLLQILTAGIGLLTCVATPLSAAVLAYILRGASRIHFSGRSSFQELSPEEAAIVRGDSKDGLFMAGVLVGLLITLILTGLSVAFGLPAVHRPPA